MPTLATIVEVFSIVLGGLIASCMAVAIILVCLFMGLHL
jgi:hypothetical protein